MFRINKDGRLSTLCKSPCIIICALYLSYLCQEKALDCRGRKAKFIRQSDHPEVFSLTVAFHHVVVEHSVVAVSSFYLCVALDASFDSTITGSLSVFSVAVEPGHLVYSVSATPLIGHLAPSALVVSSFSATATPKKYW